MARSGWKTAGLVAGVGCLSIVAVIVGGVIIAALYARASMRNLGDPTPQSVERRIEIPQPPAPIKGQAATSANRTSPLRVRLELQEGTFTIRPGQPGSEIHVEGRFAPGLFELTQSTSDSADGSGAREVRVRFKSKISGWQRFFASIGTDDDDGPQLTVTLPRGTPIDLTLQLTMGRSEIDLGGLTLTEVDLNASMGEHKIDFREPVVETMRELRLNASMGNVVIEHLGNARAETITGHGSMGNVTADLAGAWPPGSSTDLSF